MTLPQTIYAGDAISWSDTGIGSAATAVVYYLRTNANSGATVSGSYSSVAGWVFGLSAAVSGKFEPGVWRYQVIATVSGAPTTIRKGSFNVEASLAYTGLPQAVDLRSQAQQDLDAVESAIRSLTTGAQEYWIGSRKVKRPDLPELIKWRDRLKYAVVKEKRAESIANGLGDPHRLYVRFQ